MAAKKAKTKKEEPVAVLSPAVVNTAEPPADGSDGADVAGYVNIVDERKIRYDIMKKKKALKAAEDAAKKMKDKKPLTSEEQAAVDQVAADEKAVLEEKTAIKKDKGPAHPKKKKSHKTQLLVITNEKQLVDACVGILNNIPNGEHIHLSVIGDRLRVETGHSWNKKFKQTYGTLPQFFANHPESFHVNKDQIVFLKAEYEAIKASSDPLGAAKKKKKKTTDQKLDVKGEDKKEVPKKSAATGVIPEVTKKRRRRRDSGTEEEVEDEEAGTSTTLRLIFVVLLVIVVMMLTFIALEGVSFGEFLSRVRANLNK